MGKRVLTLDVLHKSAKTIVLSMCIGVHVFMGFCFISVGVLSLEAG